MDTKITTTPEKNKLKIKVPVVQSADHEIEIDLPYYLNRNDWFIKIVSRSKLIRVSVADYEGGYNSISFFEPGETSLADDIAKGTPIKEQEFNEAFQTALTKIQNL